MKNFTSQPNSRCPALSQLTSDLLPHMYLSSNRLTVAAYSNYVHRSCLFQLCSLTRARSLTRAPQIQSLLTLASNNATNTQNLYRRINKHSAPLHKRRDNYKKHHQARSILFMEGKLKLKPKK